ncbi:uncharacterized protein BDZ83DRAFT_34095 [Colletotrichum acutatum]|uniref:Uncharacterized protein n=1 Tax=Glomerella acutata TaxID=27357 RepID=A0AAD9D115_GLOAC|nr:uncharacterized protein BDZ83DRAFT_34095 [Colletotrichum acutatum]KAK1729506.1 hypothetical protein BDZ83DRAFT_34095 [Colletotrichum acutatum]
MPGVACFIFGEILSMLIVLWRLLGQASQRVLVLVLVLCECDSDSDSVRECVCVETASHHRATARGTGRKRGEEPETGDRGALSPGPKVTLPRTWNRILQQDRTSLSPMGFGGHGLIGLCAFANQQASAVQFLNGDRAELRGGTRGVSGGLRR